MSHLLKSPSNVLQRLENEEFEVKVCGGNLLVVLRIPYLNSRHEIKAGILALPLQTSGDVILPPPNHTASWIGERPCNIDGSYIEGLVNGPNHKDLGYGLTQDYFLSCWPVKFKGQYPDYYEKVKTYCQVISTPAYNTNAEACKKLTNPIIIQDEDSVFQYGDTNASRAGIDKINGLAKGMKIAIIGLGGTGSYILDAIAKTPVAEIHLFDGDYFNTHNAFRAPGAPSIEELREQPKKVDYLYNIYSKMHKGIHPHGYRITSENISELNDMDFVFLAVDDSAIRNLIANHLIDLGKPIIDSGLGLVVSNQQIAGQVRVTAAIAGHYDHLKESFSADAVTDDAYATTIQIAELNQLAAVLSVIKWKKLIGSYSDISENDFDVCYSIPSNKIIHSEDGKY